MDKVEGSPEADRGRDDAEGAGGGPAGASVRAGDQPPMQAPRASGLPRALERRLARRYGRTAAGRVTASAALRAVRVLLRQPPRTAPEMAGVGGLVQAARSGVQELTAGVESLEPAEAEVPTPAAAPALSRDELRRFRRRLRQEAKRRAARAED
jgi:hypothetical protein